MTPTDSIAPGCILRCGHYRPFMAVDREDARGVRLVECTRCGLVYEHPRPSREEIDAFYSDERLWTASKDPEGRSRSYVAELEAKRPVFDDLVRRIERFKQEGRLLDVGAGAGLLERALDSRRWSVTGVELSPYIAEFGREQLGSNVIAGAFEDVELGTEGFDAIVMKYTLDHMEEPYAALARARELIRPDGLLVLADLINIRGFSARFFREGFRLIHPM